MTTSNIDTQHNPEPCGQSECECCQWWRTQRKQWDAVRALLVRVEKLARNVDLTGGGVVAITRALAALDAHREAHRE